MYVEDLESQLYFLQILLHGIALIAAAVFPCADIARSPLAFPNTRLIQTHINSWLYVCVFMYKHEEDTGGLSSSRHGHMLYVARPKSS